MTRRVRLTGIIEDDEDRVLIAAEESDGSRVTFHLSKDNGGPVDTMIRMIMAGDEVYADIPDAH